ncbi:MAG: hypothetical protein ACE5FY_07355, partial [Nitrospiria bacterium]
MLNRIQFSLVLALLVSTPTTTFSDTSIPAFLLKAVDDAQAFLVNRDSSPLSAQTSLIDSAEFRWNIDIDLGNKKDNETAYELRLKPKAYGQREAEQKILALH